MKRMVMGLAAGVVCACAVAAAARPVPKADGRWMATRAVRGTASPLEWEYTGSIVDKDGNAVSGPLTLVVGLYAAAEGGDALWLRKAPAVLDADGAFSVRLSDALQAPEGAPDAPLDTVLCAQACWIECRIDGHPGAMSPRAAVASVPYALFADGATGSRADFEVAGSLTVDGETRTKSLSARGAEVSGGLEVTGTMSVAGDVSAAGGLKAGSLSGLGPVPVGTIILWHGEKDDVPAGWAACDGSVVNGVTTPNLSGRFPVGAGNSYNPWDVGGAATVELSWDEMPSHSHGYQKNCHANTDEPAAAANDNRGVWSGWTTSQTTGAGGSGTGDKGAPHENLPPYKALWYIMRVE